LQRKQVNRVRFLFNFDSTQHVCRPLAIKLRVG